MHVYLVFILKLLLSSSFFSFFTGVGGAGGSGGGGGGLLLSFLWDFLFLFLVFKIFFFF